TGAWAMDDQQTREFGTDRDSIKRGSGAAIGAATTRRDNLEQSRNQNAGQNAGGDGGQGSEQNANAGTIEQAKTMARNVGEQAWSAATSAGTAAQDLARRAREQTGGVIDPLYQQGARAGEYLTRNVNEYPLAALLVAGAVGYGL